MSDFLNEQLSERLSQASCVIFDNDGVTYPYSALFQANIYKAVVQTIRHFLPHMSDAEAYQEAKESYDGHGSPYHRLKMRHAIADDQLHDLHHRLCDVAWIEKMSLRAAFEDFHLPRAMLTHGSREWTMRVLDRLDIADRFVPEKIFAWEDVGFKSKAHSPDPFRQILDACGYQASATLMIEDSQANLVHAKQLGMITVLVGAGDKIYEHVDFKVPDLAAFLKVASFVGVARPEPVSLFPNAPKLQPVNTRWRINRRPDCKNH